MAPASSFTFSPSLSPFAITVEEHLAAHPEYEGIAAGALVFDSQNRLLIIQRASHDSMPNRWEVPGGACDLTDETILHGIAREVFEESGLRVTNLKHQLEPPYDHTVFLTSTKKLRICKYTFETEVESTEEVKLDPNEHQMYLWVSEEECRSHCVEKGGERVEIKFTHASQEGAILEGFRMRKVVGTNGA